MRTVYPSSLSLIFSIVMVATLCASLSYFFTEKDKPQTEQVLSEVKTVVAPVATVENYAILEFSRNGEIQTYHIPVGKLSQIIADDAFPTIFRSVELEHKAEKVIYDCTRD